MVGLACPRPPPDAGFPGGRGGARRVGAAFSRFALGGGRTAASRLLARVRPGRIDPAGGRGAAAISARLRIPRASGCSCCSGEGRLELAEQYVEALEADAAPGKALVSRLRLEADRGGDDHVRALRGDHRAKARLERTPTRRNSGPFCLTSARRGRSNSAARSLDRIAERFSGSLWLNTIRVRLKIRHRDDAEAIALIDAIPQRNVRPRGFGAARLGAREARRTRRGETALARSTSRRCFSPPSTAR